MPTAIPNSPDVSDIDATDPARSGGADCIMTPIVSVDGSMIPKDVRHMPKTSRPRPWVGPTCV